MTKLSVNINKIALIRNARGANYPDLVKTAMDCEEFGAQGITIHPRPDQRHVKYSDIPLLKEVVTTELNIEGYPTEEFMQVVLRNRPHQCTLVPDAPEAITSDNGWDTIKHLSFLKEITERLHDAGIRVSLFIDPIAERLDAAKETGTDRIEFYTGPFAHAFQEASILNGGDQRQHKQTEAVASYARAAAHCQVLEMGINAGHDLNLANVHFFRQHVPALLEVSIGHALVCDALYLGLKNTIQLYLKEIN